MKQDPPGHLILVMAPSGSGKGLLLQHIRENVPEACMAISCTTREPRPGEVDGEVYHFLSPEEFQTKIDNGEFLEWAEFSGNRYGTLKAEILEPMQAGCLVVREVELQGVLALRELIAEEDRTIVYIEAGSWEVLKRRIQERAPISEEHLRLRHERYQEESKWKAFADVVIENNENRLDEAKQELEKLVRSCLQTIKPKS